MAKTDKKKNARKRTIEKSNCVERAPNCDTNVTSYIQAIFVGIIALVAISCASIQWNLFDYARFVQSVANLIEESSTQTEIHIESHQNYSLREKYDVDYSEMIRVREQKMKKYGYNYSFTGVDKRSKLNLQEYRDVYDGKWPVVITDVVSQWAAINWTRDFFAKKYGDQRTTMKAVHGTLDDAVSLALPLELFHQNTDKAYAHSWTYLEDELFIPRRPELYSMIGKTPYLEEDYFRLFPEEVRPWNAMLLWGTAFSRSSLHIDPYNWTGTNAVISGRKRWKLYPPGQDHLLSVRRDQLSGFPLNCYKYNSFVDAFSPTLSKNDNIRKAQVLEFDQLPGELLIIPTGWFHQAYNVEETIAVSSQVTNRNNYRIVLEEVLKVTANLDRSRLPENIDQLPPPEQVSAVLSLLPDHILQRGKAVTQDAINQVEQGKTGANMRQP